MSNNEEPLEALELELRLLASGLAQDEPVVDQDRLIGALRRMDELGVSRAMTPAESVRVSLDNLSTMLEDIAGIRALRDGLVLGARLIDAMADTTVDDWWGGTEPEVLVAYDAKSTGAGLFYDFGGRLIRDLGNSRNLLAVPAPNVEAVDPDAEWPPVYTVVTDHSGFREWAFSWGGQLIWFEVDPSGFVVEQQTALGTELSEHFRTNQLDEAVHVVGEWIAEPPDRGANDYLTVDEHRAIEVVVYEAIRAIDKPGLSDEERLQIRVLTDILLLQMRAPEPDRTIIGRALSGIGKFAAGVLVGVAATYLQALLTKFGLPPP